MSAAIASGYLAAFPPSLEVNADVAQGHGWPVVEHQQYAMQGVIANDCWMQEVGRKPLLRFLHSPHPCGLAPTVGALGAASAPAHAKYLHPCRQCRSGCRGANICPCSRKESNGRVRDAYPTVLSQSLGLKNQSKLCVLRIFVVKLFNRCVLNYLQALPDSLNGRLGQRLSSMVKNDAIQFRGQRIDCFYVIVKNGRRII
jgi:hypothetical protein